MKNHVMKANKAKGNAKSKQTTKAVTTVAAKSPTAKTVASKIYPSVQTRAIINCEQLCSEITALVEACTEAEGLEGAALAKATNFRAKVEAKLGDENLKRTLEADNVRETSSDQGTEQLGIRGKTVRVQMQILSSKLTYLVPLLKSMTCTDEMEIEWSPAFLARCVADAKAMGLQVPLKCRVEAILRHVKAAVGEGNLHGAICIIDEKIDTTVGIQQLADAPRHVQHEVQVTATMYLLRLYMENPKYDLADVTKAAELLKALAKGETLLTLLVTLQTALTSANKDAEQAIVRLHTGGPEFPPGTKEMFTQGGGAEYLAAARRAYHQRTIDAGTSLHHIDCLT